MHKKVNCEIYSKGGLLNSKWKDYAYATGYVPIEQGNLEIEKSIEKKLNIFYRDGGHFNELGNYIYGKGFFDEFVTIK